MATDMSPQQYIYKLCSFCHHTSSRVCRFRTVLGFAATGLCLKLKDKFQYTTAYEWQVNNLKVRGFANKLNEEPKKRGLAYIWHS
jgi:hypothetical protein